MDLKLILLTLIVLGYLGNLATALQPGGKGVTTRYEIYYTDVLTSRQTIAGGYNHCTKTGWWTGVRKTCRWINTYKWVYVYKRVSRKRVIYVCKFGWRKVYNRCEPICTPKCGNGGTCTNPNTCSCRSGYKGNYCQHDVNECYYSSTCSHNCHNTFGSYYCSCRIGYSSNGNLCYDKDECQNAQVCGFNSRCLNTQGSYNCLCKMGYASSSYDGKNCKDIDECDQASGVNHGCAYNCTNNIGSYKCLCPTGHYLASDERSCTDFNECETNNGGCMQNCVNFPGYHTCTCRDGYSVNTTDIKSCDDIDECDTGTSGCGHICTNTIGSFICSCQIGYNLAWDKKTCYDVDECNETNGGCSHNCLNTNGSYYCSCRPGFSLNPDKKSCHGIPCWPVHAPIYGKKMCNGYTTERICYFQCRMGYEITGSSNRTCLPSRNWSGTETRCRVLHCKFPREPRDGSIYRPCYTKYKSKCEFGCDAGFFSNDKSNKISCNAKKEWEPQNITCQKSQVCMPNPCVRNGKCTPLNGKTYVCNCIATGNTGKNCQLGEIKTPLYKTLKVGQTTELLEISASPPSNNVILAISSIGAEFVPSKIIFNKTDNYMIKVKRYVRITALYPGAFEVQYVIFGTDANDYQSLPPDILVITDPAVPSKSINLDKISGFYRIGIHECPNGDHLTASSTTPWRNFGNNMLTTGIVKIHSGSGYKLPYRIAGVDIKRNLTLNGKETVKSDDKVGSQESAQNNFIGQLTISRALQNAFVSSIQPSLPNWLKLIFLHDENYKCYAGYKIASFLLYGRQLKERLSGFEHSIKNNTLYSVLLSSGHANLTVDNDSLTLPTFGRDEPMTLATELCESRKNNFLLALPRMGVNFVSKLTIFERLRQSGWTTKVRSIQFLTGTKIPPGEFFNGINNSVKVRITKVNLALLLQVKKQLIASDLFNMTLSFDGSVYAQTSEMKYDLDTVLKNPVKAQLDGKTTVLFILNILGNKTKIAMTSNKASTYMASDGMKNKFDEGLNVHTIYSVLNVKEDPFQTSELGRYVTPDTSKEISFAVHKASGNNNSTAKFVSFSFSGDLKFGAVMFFDYQIRMYVVENPKTEVQVFGTSTKMDSNNFEKFFDIGSGDALKVNMTVPSNTGGVRTVLETSVNVLGIRSTVRCEVREDKIMWKDEGELFGIYKARYNASIIINTTADGILITGVMISNNTDDLPDFLASKANAIVFKMFGKANERYERAKLALSKSIQQLNSIKSLYKQKKDDAENAEQIFKQARDKFNKTKTELDSLETSARISSKNFTLLEDRLKSLCSTKHCDDVCVKGEKCAKCYKFLTGTIKAMCDAVCHKTITSKTGPFKKKATCLRRECLWYKKKGSFWDIAKPVLKGVAKLALVGVGVNPALAHFGVELTSKLIGSARKTQQGLWECQHHVIECQKNSYRYSYEDIPYECKQPCQKTVITKKIPYDCCEQNECATKIPDAKCIVENERCDKMRILALLKLDKSQAKAATAIRALSKMKKKNLFESMDLKIADIKKTLSLNALERTRQLLEDSIRANHNAINAKKEVERLTGYIRSLEPFLKSRKPFINVVSVHFETKQKSKNPYQQQLLPIVANVVSTNNKQTLLKTVLDFNNLNRSLQVVSEEIVTTIFDEFSQGQIRKRRSFNHRNETEGIPSLQNFHVMCSEFQNSMSGLREIILSIIDYADVWVKYNAGSRSNITLNRTSLHFDIKINGTLAEELGINISRTKRNISAGEKPLLNKIEQILQTTTATSKDSLESNILFRAWHATMENIYNQSGQGCSGFDDCLTNTVDTLFELFDSYYHDESHAVFGILRSTNEQVGNLTRNLNATAHEVLRSAITIQSLLDKLFNENVFCTIAPNITHHPPALLELGSGGNLVLVCNATGEALSFSWLFNNTIVIGQTSNILMIKNVTRSHEGEYRCVAKNHVNSEKSTPTDVVIHTPPTITRHPKRYLNAKLGSYAYFECEGESTEVNISYQWYKLNTFTKNYTSIISQIYPVLVFQNVSEYHKGWYACRVLNSYGTSTSKPAFLEPLRYSLPVPGVVYAVRIKSEEHEIEGLPESYQNVKRKLKSTLNELKKCDSGNATVQVDDVRTISCKLHDSNEGKNTSTLVCNWQVQLGGWNISNITGTEEEEMSTVMNATMHLKKVTEQLIDVINKGKKGFIVYNTHYTFLKDASGILNYIMNCPKDQPFQPDYFSCVNCPPGSRSASDNTASGCLQCPKGMYQPNQGQTNCLVCPKGMTTELEGSRGSEDCKLICQKGYFGNIGNDGQTKCVLCPGNTFQPLAGQFECLPCPMATFTEGGGKIDRSDCKTVTKPTRRNEEKSTAFQETNTPSKEQNYVVTTIPAEIRKEDHDVGPDNVVIIGTTVGCITGLTLLFGLLLVLYRRKKPLIKRRKNKVASNSFNDICSDSGTFDLEEELRTFNNLGYTHDSGVNTSNSGSEDDNKTGITLKPKGKEKLRSLKFKLPFTKKEYKEHQASQKNTHAEHSKNRDSTYSKKPQSNFDCEKEKPTNELQIIPIAFENVLYGTSSECVEEISNHDKVNA